jgi:hypothetical protein
MRTVFYTLVFVWSLCWSGYSLSTVATGNYDMWPFIGVLLHLYLLGMCFVDYTASRFGRN